MSYDQKCYDLAALFLSDVQNPVKHEDAHKLAQEIQTTIEDYLNELERNQEQPPEDDMSPTLRAMIERDTKNALAMAKVMDHVFDTLLSPRTAK